MSKNLLLVYLFIFFFTKAEAFSITGTVEDSSTHLPITGACVFIDKTQIFCETDSAGNFELDNVGFDYFDLIVAAKGYQYLPYRFTKDFINKKIRFQLASLPADSSLKKITEQWEKVMMGRIFSDTVNNKSYNYILNPEVLSYSYDNSSRTLKIKATDKLYFLNELLGYMMNIFIDEITIAPNKEYFLGYVYYTSLNYKNQQAVEQCNLRRKSVYNVSLMHFIRALYQNTLSPEGYQVNIAIRAFEGSDEFKKFTQNQNTDIFQSNLVSPKRFIYLYDKKPASGEDLLVKDSATGALFISPDNFSILSVVNQKNMLEYNSKLFFTPGIQIRLESNGMYFEPGDMLIEGYWHRMKLETQLPFDYMAE